MPNAPHGICTFTASDGTVLTPTEFSLEDDFCNPLGAYRFSLTPVRKDFARVYALVDRGELISVKVNGSPLCTPIITTRDAEVGKGGATIQIEAKSVLCTPYEGSSDPEVSKKWKEDVSVDKVVTDILDQYGFDELVTDSTAHVAAMTAGPKLKTSKKALHAKDLTLRELQGQDTETAYQILSRVFLRLGCAVHANWQGSVLICQPDYDQESAYGLVQDSDFSHAGDRILEEPALRWHESNDGLYSEVVVRGQLPDDPSPMNAGLPISRIGPSNEGRPASAPYGKVPLTPLKYTQHGYKSSVARYKPRFVCDKDARDAEACQHAARTIIAARTKDAFVLECAVEGMVSKTGRIWAPNTIADVYVEAIGLQERMWLLGRTISGTQEGQMTKLKLIPRGALTIGADT